MHPRGGVNFMALPIRFSNTWRSRSRSARIPGRSGDSSSRSSSAVEAASAYGPDKAIGSAPACIGANEAIETKARVNLRTT
jgi:hypothetical protein